ncbi:MAG: SAM-dependent DNA methyltransferase [Acidobacteria bacterium]|nr:SAM-dependent DNA methyltransferase [Acidobacteriota bacterium]
MPPPTYRQHEVQFCSEVSKWADRLFESRPDLPFGSSDIESFGRGSHKRQDFRVYERKEKGRGKLALCGEVKLPGSPEGRSPFDPALMKDAFDKATNENCRYFFTWNVEELVVFDRSLWDAESMYERHVERWPLGLELNSPADLTRPEVVATIRDKFLPRFFEEFADIWLERKKDLRPLPDVFYVTVIESHLTGPMGPVRELRDYLSLESQRSKTFDSRLRQWAIEQQWNFDRNDPKSWRETIDRAARSMVYVLSNRILFYQAVRFRNGLPELKRPRSANTPPKALEYLRRRFQEAVDATGDYEPVFFPDSQQWSAEIALSGVNSLEAWDKFIRAVDRFNFKEIPTDILGHTFQKLIGPEERQKFGQYYTDENIVDVINAFCIHKAEANVFDPACGSGTFLVRAYYRKHQRDKRLANHELIAGLYGCDINPFPAHLATLNLAARNISNEENYPRVIRRNFFTVEVGKPFCELPDILDHKKREKIELPVLDAVVGNPPYVRQEQIPKKSEKGVIPDQSKEHIYERAERAWPGLRLSRQSDLYVYFWPVAAQFLADDGWFGFLTSSSWLDVRYGFPLQRWVLLNFRIVAIIESVDEPWFPDARVKTAVTILQRCKSEQERNVNLVRFVRLKQPLAEILGEREDEGQRQDAAERLRDLILKTKSDRSTDRFRIMVKRQGDLWQEGLSIGEMFARQKDVSLAESDAAEEETENDEEVENQGHKETEGNNHLMGDYGGGKWGRYLRAPDFYFDLMREFGGRFTRLGEVATIKRGITSGCDAFFMPRDVSKQILEKNQSEFEWKVLPLMRRCPREAVESGEVVIVKCGDGTLHPIEKEFVRPEVHSLMQVDRPVVSPDQLDRVVLWVNQDLRELKGTYVHHYITWGSKQTFASRKSKAVPVPQRSTCAGRPRWYDVTGLEPGIGFWPMAQKYRHIIPWNKDRLPCNHNLFDIHPGNMNTAEQNALMAILNSTLVGLLKHFYGRYAGAEGTLKTEVVDVLMLEIPSPLYGSAEVSKRLSDALERLCRREITHLVEESFLNCHTEEKMRELQAAPLELPLELQRQDRKELDLLVFELLGVTNPRRREELVDRLYRETSLYHREQRVQDIHSTINRAKGKGGSVSQMELALDAWNKLDSEWRTPLAEWLEEQTGRAKIISLPEGEVRLSTAENFVDAETVYFGKKPAVSHVCASRAEAELLAAIAREGLRGPVSLPATGKECAVLARMLESRLSEAKARFEELASERAGTDRLRAQVVDQLHRWFIHGRH